MALLSLTYKYTFVRRGAVLGTDMSPSPLPTQCEGCSSKFSWLRKRRTCLMCRSVCCSSCMQRLRLCGVGRHCLRCARLAGVRYDRAALQQMPIRDLKHIMKIVDVSSATCREKSDLVDTILKCRDSTGQSDSPAAPSAPPADPEPPAPRPGRSRPAGSGRVAHYESIRVRAVDDPESCPPQKESNVPSDRRDSDSSSVSREQTEAAYVVVDVETIDDRETIDTGPAGRQEDSGSDQAEPATDNAVDVETGPVDVEADGSDEVDVEGGVDSPVDVDAASEAITISDDSGSEVEVVADDPDEPQSESVAIEVDMKKDGDAAEPTSDPDLDLSRLTDVAQIPSEALIDRLTVRQCKRLLQHRRTDYRDVIEKEELLRRVRQLWRETKRNAEALASATDRDICKVCMDALVNCVMLECGHMATCIACGKQMAECPICRKYVVRVVHVFRS